MQRRVRALESEGNAHHASSDWHSANWQARVKLKRLYPVVKVPLD